MATVLQTVRLKRVPHLSIRKAAQKADIDPATLGKAESGRILSPAQLERIAAVYEWAGDPADLLREDTSGE